ncbi:hypothetical protein G3N96_26225 [Burkholderia sp. Se-20373]|uniref:hypothetical protein n=1 Tax=Burkholderia sp. Se-20373 TaxID=2703898 RepID=UPI001980B32C|nr:hypothetical protein [Burkholderia sp. Se-20373]MBN3748897.1 hypothetical protein [Burkholderia sp. Se-20373]
MKYYVLSQRADPGCPTLNGALYDKYYQDTTSVGVGYFPWYANPSRGKAHEKFPDGVVFITKDDRYDFDVRADLGFHYLMSERFGAVVSELNVPMVDVAPVRILSLEGTPASGDGYCVAIFPSFRPEEVDGGESKFLGGKFWRNRKNKEAGCIRRFRMSCLQAEWHGGEQQRADLLRGISPRSHQALHQGRRFSGCRERRLAGGEARMTLCSDRQ